VIPPVQEIRKRPDTVRGERGAWVHETVKGGLEMRAICGQGVRQGKSLIGTAQLSFHVFGMSGERRENFLQLDPTVMRSGSSHGGRVAS
jgi:hypothetical protein